MSAQLSDQVAFMKQQALLAFGWMGLTSALAVMLPLSGVDTDTLAYLLVAFACTLSLPLAFLIAWRRSPQFRDRVLGLDLGPVVLLETGRILGLSILVLYALDELPAEFAFWGGGIDVLIGVTALTFAYLVLALRPFPRRLFVGWNLLGIVDFVVAWPVIFLFSPTAAGVLAGSGPTTEAFLEFPMSFIPMFGVPFTCCLHLIALLQVRHHGVPSVSPLFRATREPPIEPAPPARAPAAVGGPV